MQPALSVCITISLAAHLCLAAVAGHLAGRWPNKLPAKDRILFISLETMPARTSPATRPYSVAAPTQQAFSQKAYHKEQFRRPASGGEKTGAAKLADPPAAGTETGRSPAAALSGLSSHGTQAAADSAPEVAFGSSTGPAFVEQAPMRYPAVARRFGREGKVTLRLTVSETGALLGIEVLQDPGFGFAAAAIEALRKSRFSPARNEGRPVRVKAILPVRFTLEDAN